jgi:hypothetical protein
MTVQIKAGQTLTHPCGLMYKHPGPQTLELAGDSCPQCGQAVTAKDHIKGGIPNTVVWKLIPPHGTSFKNELGSEVTIKFEAGQETEMFQCLQTQLHTLYAASQRKLGPNSGVKPSGPNMGGIPLSSLSIDPETGTLISKNPNE